MTVFVPVSITETSPGLSPEFATYTLVLSGVTAIPIGAVPTFTVAVILFVDVLITDTCCLCLQHIQMELLLRYSPALES